MYLDVIVQEYKSIEHHVKHEKKESKRVATIYTEACFNGYSYDYFSSSIVCILI